MQDKPDDNSSENTLQKKSLAKARGDGVMKAFILSGIVFPGLGQLSQGKKLLGVFLVVLSGVLLITLFEQLFSQIHYASQDMIASGQTSIADAYAMSTQILQSLEESSVLLTLYCILATWVFSMVEVFRKPKS